MLQVSFGQDEHLKGLSGYNNNCMARRRRSGCRGKLSIEKVSKAARSPDDAGHRRTSR